LQTIGELELLDEEEEATAANDDGDWRLLFKSLRAIVSNEMS